jgi:transcription factor TFIIIB component B''
MRNKPRQLSVSSSVRPTLDDSSQTQTQELTQSPILSETLTQKDSLKDKSGESAVVDEEAIEEVDDELPPPTDKRERKASANNKPVASKPPSLAASTAAKPSVTPAPPPTFGRSTPGNASPRLSSLNRGSTSRATSNPVGPSRGTPVSASRSAVFQDSTPTADSTPSSRRSSVSSSSGSSTPAVAATATKPAPPQRHGFAAINSNVRSLRSTRGESPGPSTSLPSSSLPIMGQSIITDTLEPLAAPPTTTSATASATSTRRSSKSKPAKTTRSKGKGKGKAPTPTAEVEDEEEEDGELDSDEAMEKEETVAPPAKVFPVDENGFLIVDPEDIPNPRRGKKASTIEDADKKVINIEKFTMGHLCKDIPIGQTNDDYDNYEEARRKRKHKREAMLREKKRAKIEGRPLTSIPGFLEGQTYLADGLQAKKEKWDEAWKKNVDSGAQVKPQLKFDSNRQIIIDEDSLQYDRHQRDSKPSEERIVEEEDKYSTSINSATFSKREKPERWDQDETSAFYKALSQFGTDFNLITQLFPGRSRRQIKAKFKLEERRNPGKIHLAILRKLPVDVNSYSEQTGATIHTMAEIDKELEKVRLRHEEHLKEVEDHRVRARAEDAAAAARADEEKYGPQPNIKKKEENEEEEEVVGYVDRGGNR